MMRYFFKDDFERDPAAVEKHLRGAGVRERLEKLADVLEGLEAFGHDDIEQAVRGLAADLGVKAGELIHPCRVALTGRSVSPDLFAVVQLVGRERSVARLREAAAAVSG